MRISLPNTSKKALVDDSDYAKLTNHNWFYDTRQDRVTTVVNGKSVNMSRFVLDDFTSPVIDHINGDRLDNRRENLRPATYAQNSANRAKQKNCVSKYKGVCWSKSHKCWMAYIEHQRKRSYLGYFTNEETAGRAYDEAALKLHKEFAVLNFPKGGIN